MQCAAAICVYFPLVSARRTKLLFYISVLHSCKPHKTLYLVHALGGQGNMDPDPKFRFLENHHILEFGLEEDFIIRHDLAVMVRDLFMWDLDLARLNHGLSSYIRMFRPQLDDSASLDVDDPGMYWKTLMQIVCLVRETS